jgi:hypothetical protein
MSAASSTPTSSPIAKPTRQDVLPPLKPTTIQSLVIVSKAYTDEVDKVSVLDLSTATFKQLYDTLINFCNLAAKVDDGIAEIKKQKAVAAEKAKAILLTLHDGFDLVSGRRNDLYSDNPFPTFNGLCATVENVISRATIFRAIQEAADLPLTASQLPLEDGMKVKLQLEDGTKVDAKFKAYVAAPITPLVPTVPPTADDEDEEDPVVPPSPLLVPEAQEVIVKRHGAEEETVLADAVTYEKTSYTPLSMDKLLLDKKTRFVYAFNGTTTLKHVATLPLPVKKTKKTVKTVAVKKSKAAAKDKPLPKTVTKKDVKDREAVAAAKSPKPINYFVKADKEMDTYVVVNSDDNVLHYFTGNPNSTVQNKFASPALALAAAEACKKDLLAKKAIAAKA